MERLTPPKVFVSHASEDKERFVIPFATALRQRGIDAWVDRWEMLPGDSLVDKIFEEGLKEAAAVLIILSSISVTKPWVREELNAAVVNRIEKGTRVIPIVLDCCEVPQSLRSLVWESVPDLNDFSNCLSRVVDSVLGSTMKPPIGAAPSYLLTDSQISLGGLTSADSFLLIKLYEVFLERGRDYVSPEFILEVAQSKGIDASIVSESLAVLEHKGYVELLKTLGHGPYNSRIESYGVSLILGKDEQKLIKSVGLCLVNEGTEESTGIASAINQPNSLVCHAIDCLERQGYINVARAMDGVAYVHNVSPTLRRALAS